MYKWYVTFNQKQQYSETYFQLDKNKIVVHLHGVDTLINQLSCDEIIVQEKALHCISYATMNGKFSLLKNKLFIFIYLLLNR